MDNNTEKVNDAVLALLYLGSWSNEFGSRRAWKGMDWSVMDQLYDSGWIDDPKSAAKSVWLTDEGIARGNELAAPYFAK